MLGTIFAGLGAAKAGADYIQGRRNRTKSFDDTALGKLLKQRSETGAWTPTIRSGILGNVSRRAGNIASQNRARVRGGLIRSGMENSIAGQSLLTSPDRDLQRSIADTSRDIEMKNEFSKIRAAEDYAKGVDDANAQRTLENRQDWTNLTSGLLGAAQTGYNIYQNERAYEDNKTLQNRELDIREIYYNSRNADDFFRLSSINPADFVKMNSAEIADLARRSGLSIDQIEHLKLDAYRRVQQGGN